MGASRFFRSATHTELLTNNSSSIHVFIPFILPLRSSMQPSYFQHTSSIATTMSAEESKNLGNEAFKTGEYAKAVELYSKAITLDGSNHIFYSNRSGAHLAQGDAFHALQDANECIKLAPEFIKGYTRKGSALHALHRFKDAINCLEEALVMFPGNDVIKKHISELKKKKILVDETVRDNIARATASKQRQKEAPKSMSEFVQYSKALMELQIASLQAQLKLINALGEMPDEDKLELLFSFLDKDKDGFIDARELSDGIRKRNEGMTYAEGLDRSIKMVALFDTDGNAKLDPVEFKTLIDTMLSEMGISFHELSEYLIFQFLFSESGNDPIEDLVGELVSKEIDQAVVEKSKFYDALADDRMHALFHEFDMDGDGVVSFAEVALGLFRMTRDMEESAKVAVKLLCMLEKNDRRELTFHSFARLIMNFCAAGEFKFDDVADDLTLLMCQPTVVTEAELTELIIADAVYNMAIEMQEAAEEEEEVIDTLTYGRMHKLFDLWDENHDGFIDFEELLKGMRQFQTTLAIDESIQRAAQALLAFDDDGNQKLDREEFARALTNFAKAAEVDIHEFIDFLVVTAALSENDVIESAYIHAISAQATAEIKLVQNLEVEYIAIE